MRKTVVLMLVSIVMSACQSVQRTATAPVIEKSEGEPAVVEPSVEARDSGSTAEHRPRANSAVVALLDLSRQQAGQQQYDAAAASLERAIRISPRDAELYLELAKVRDQQGNSAQAEQLCKKAIALSDDVGSVKVACEKLIWK